MVAVVNFPPKQIGPFMSECLVIGAVNDEKAAWCCCARTATPRWASGSRRARYGRLRRERVERDAPA